MGELHPINRQKIDNKYLAVKLSRVLLGKSNRVSQIQLSRETQHTRYVGSTSPRVAFPPSLARCLNFATLFYFYYSQSAPSDVLETIKLTFRTLAPRQRSSFSPLAPRSDEGLTFETSSSSSESENEGLMLETTSS